VNPPVPGRHGARSHANGSDLGGEELCREYIDDAVRDGHGQFAHHGKEDGGHELILGHKYLGQHGRACQKLSRRGILNKSRHLTKIVQKVLSK
jgi:hypothetical protein